jgi:hypothetical protein
MRWNVIYGERPSMVSLHRPQLACHAAVQARPEFASDAQIDVIYARGVING